jgi:hypothetical protein
MTLPTFDPDTVAAAIRAGTADERARARGLVWAALEAAQRDQQVGYVRGYLGAWMAQVASA